MKQEIKIDGYLLQSSLIKEIITNEQYALKVLPMMDINMFPKMEQREIIKTVVDYFERNGSKSFDLDREGIELLIKSRIKDEVKLKVIQSQLDFTYGCNKIDSTYIQENGYKLLKDGFIKATINSAQLLAQDGNIDKAIERIKSLDSIKNNSINKGFKVTRLGEQLKYQMTQERVKMLVGPIIGNGETHILFARPGVGKSILAYQIAEELTNGNNVFEFLPNECGKQNVLYFDYELSPAQRLKRYGNGKIGQEESVKDFNFGIVDVESDVILKNYPKKDAIDRNIEMFKAILADNNETTVLIIDNISAIGDGVMEKSAGPTKLLQSLRTLKLEYAKTTGILLTIIVIGHTPKLKEFEVIYATHLAGSSQLGNLVDGMSSVGKSIRGKSKIYWKQTKNSRSFEGQYEFNNVISLERVKEDDGYLKYIELGFNTEDYHIDEMVTEERDESIMKIINLYKKGMSYSQIEKETNESHGKVQRVITAHKAELKKEDANEESVKAALASRAARLKEKNNPVNGDLQPNKEF